MQTSEFYSESDLYLESNLSFDGSNKEEKGYKCIAPGCNQVLRIRKFFEQHMKAHYGEKPFSCLVGDCQKKFAQYSSYTKHMKFHSGESPYRCNLCDKLFSQLSNLKRHEHLHTGEKPYVCNHCEKSFSNVSNLKQHIQIHTDDQSRSKFDCQRCGKSYFYQNSLTKHMRSHAKKDAKAAVKKPVKDKKKKIAKVEKSESSEFSDRIEIPEPTKLIKHELTDDLSASDFYVEPSTIGSRRPESMSSDCMIGFESFDLILLDNTNTTNKKRFSSFSELFEEPKAAQETDFFEQCYISKKLTREEENKPKTNNRILSFLEADFFTEAKEDGLRKSFMEAMDNTNNQSLHAETKDDLFAADAYHSRMQFKADFEDLLQLGFTRRSRHSSFLSHIGGDDSLLF